MSMEIPSFFDGELLGDLILLGKGVGSEVYSLRGQYEGKSVKLFEKEKDDSAREGFMEEAEIHSSILHPGIVTYDDIVETDTHLGIIAEEMENSINDISIETYNEATRVRCAYEMAIVLEYLNDLDIIHSDLKPEAVFVNFGPKLTFKLGDLSAAVRLEEGGRSCPVKSYTNHYASPEHLEGRISKRSQVFCFGSLAYYISTGHDPFDQGIESDALSAIIMGNIMTLEFITIAGMSELIEECWRLDPNERPTMAQVVASLSLLVGKYEEAEFDRLPSRSIAFISEQLIALKQFFEENHKFIEPFFNRINSVLTFEEPNAFVDSLLISLLRLDATICNYRKRIQMAQDAGESMEIILDSDSHLKWFRSLDDKLQKFMQSHIDELRREAEGRSPSLAILGEMEPDVIEIQNLIGNAKGSIQTYKGLPVLGKQDMFVGRTNEISNVIDLLLQTPDSGPNIVALTGSQTLVEGSGGIGKTAVASIVAYQTCCDQSLIARFPDGVIFLTIGDTVIVGEKVNTLADIVGAEISSSTKATKSAIASEIKNKSFLLVLDDVWTTEHLESFSSLLGSNSACLVTSRMNLCEVSIHLDCLPMEGSICLLSSIFGKTKVEKVVLKTIAKRCIGIPLCLIAIAKQLTMRFRKKGKRSVLSVYTSFVRSFSQTIQYDEIQLKATEYLITAAGGDIMLQFVRSLCLLPNDEEIDVDVLKVISRGLHIDWGILDFSLLEQLDFLQVIETQEGALKFAFHDLQLNFVRCLVGETERTKYHRTVMEGYKIHYSRMFNNIKDRYFLNHFIRHLKDGYLIDLIEEMVKDGALAVWLWENSGYRDYLEELLKLASETLDNIEEVKKILRILQEKVESNGQSLLFTMSLFYDNDSPYIQSMASFIEHRNDPVAIADFGYEKDESGSIPCLFIPSISSKLVVAKTTINTFTVFDHDFNQIGDEIECLNAIPSENSKYIVVQKKGSTGDIIQVLDSKLDIMDDTEVPSDVPLCRSISNDGWYIAFHGEPPVNSYLLDMALKRTFKFIDLGCMVAPNGEFFVVYSGKKIWIIPVDWLSVFDNENLGVDKLENCSLCECKENIREVLLSNEHVFAYLTVDTTIIEIVSNDEFGSMNVSFGSMKEVRGAIVSNYSNYLVTTQCCYDVKENKRVCPVKAFPLDTENGLMWMVHDAGAKSLKVNKDMPTSDRLWYFHESERFIARHNQTSFVEVISRENYLQTFKTFDIDVEGISLSDKYLAVQTKKKEFFIFDLNDDRCVNLGQKGGDFGFTNDSKYLFFYSSNGITRWTLSGLDWSHGSGLSADIFSEVVSESFKISGVVRATFYPIINTILSFKDFWIFKHPVEDPDKKYPLVQWPLVAPLFSMSPSVDCFSIVCEDYQSLVLSGNSYRLIQRVFSLCKIAGVTCCNSQNFLSLPTLSKKSSLPYPFLVDHIFSTGDRLILCHHDKMYPVIIRGQRGDEPCDLDVANVVEKLKAFFVNPDSSDSERTVQEDI